MTAVSDGHLRLSVDDAARYLGISRPTVKRRLKRGSLRGVQERTPSGFKWYVLVGGGAADSPAGVPGESPHGAAAGTPGESPHGAPDEPPAESAAPPGMSPRSAGPSPQTAIAIQRAEEMARYTETLLTPLHARLEAQAERIGRLEEQLEAARARIAELEAPGSEAQNGPAVAQPAPEQHRWWQRLLWG